MQAYRTEAEVGGDGRVIIEGLPFSKGERVEVIVLQASPSTSGEEQKRYPLRGLPITYDAPFDSAAADDWEALK